ncbi:MAG: hypothetical protein KDB68_07240 [Planctomycetes bacterium]|nr:hypothetical protein [Planctomycetota bacterium]MCA8935985.1 hypothetical protein [Planctomycetota bacterium]
MMLFIHDMFVFLSNVHWVQLIVTLIATLIAIVLGVWLPGRLLELHTNQPAARYVWYVASLIVMVMIYISMYGYGHFWQLYSDSEETQQAAPLHRDE